MAALLEFASFEEKSKFITPFKANGQGSEFLLTTEQHIDTLLNTYQSRNDFAFRGVNDSRFRLYTSAQRLWILNNLGEKFSSYNDFIRKIISLSREENGGSIKRFLDSIGADGDIELLCYIQHFKGPTPFLDFSKNINIALYFSCLGAKMHDAKDEIDNYISLYAVALKADLEDGREVDFWRAPWETIARTREMLSRENQEIFNRGIRNINVFLDSFKMFRVAFIDEYMMGKFKLNITNNMNMLNQDGAFFYLNDDSLPLELLLEKDYNNGLTAASPTKFINCFHIHKNLIPYVIRKINLDNDFIYPNTYDMIKNIVDIITNQT